MPTPREVYAGPEGLLYMKPVDEVLDVYKTTVLDLADKPEPVQADSQWQYDGAVLKTDASDGPSTATFDVPEHYLLDCRVKLESKSRFSIVFGRQYRMTLDPTQGTLSLVGPGFNRVRACPVDTGTPVKIQVFTEGKLIECFVNDQFAKSCVIREPLAGQLEINAEGGNVEILKMVVAEAQ